MLLAPTETRSISHTGVAPMLARAALSGSLSMLPLKQFSFELDMSGKNKVVTFAQPEIRP